MTGETGEVKMEPPHIYVERSLAIIKPDAIHKAEEIEDIILRSGFAVLQVVYIIPLIHDPMFSFKFPIEDFLANDLGKCLKKPAMYLPIYWNK